MTLIDQSLFTSLEASDAMVAILSDYTRAVMRTARPHQIRRELVIMSPDEINELAGKPRRQVLRALLKRVREREQGIRV